MRIRCPLAAIAEGEGGSAPINPIAQTTPAKITGTVLAEEYNVEGEFVATTAR